MGAGRTHEARSAKAVRLLCAVVVAAPVTLPACTDRTSARQGVSAPVVFVELPAGAGFDVAAPASFRDPYPPGSRVVVWDPEAPAAAPKALGASLNSAGLLDVSPDGERVLVCAQRAAGDTWQVLELGLDGGPAVALSPADANATGAAYLAGGRVVFSSDLSRTLDPADGRPAYDLYTCARDGTDRTRISFNPSSDIDPAVLADGRIVYSAWQPPGDGRADGGWALFTVRNDGTGLAPLYGSHEGPYWKRHPAPVGDRVVFLAAAGDAASSRPAAVSLRRPLHSLTDLAPRTGGSWRSVQAWEEGRLLASLRPSTRAGHASDSFGLYLLDASPDVAPRLLRDDPSVDEVDAMSARPRREPHGHVSSVDPKASSGELLCLDARRSDREPAPSARTRRAAKLLVLRAHPRPAREPPAGGPPSARWSAGRYEPASTRVATIPLASDGSVFLEVPADAPLRFQTIDAAGELVQDSRGWVWIRPGEKRSCIGCHADRESAPPNRTPEVLGEHLPASRLPGARTGAQ